MTEDPRFQSQLRASAESGGRWGAMRSIVLQAAGFAITAILARLLTREDFGLVAITVVVVTMFDLLTSVGVGASLIRRTELTMPVVSTLFWLSLIMGGFAGLVAVLVAATAAQLAGDPDAAPLIRLAALSLPINLATSVPAGMLARRFRFRRLALLDMGGAAVYASVAIPLALSGLGALSVVVGQLARNLARLIAAALSSRFVPRLTFDRRVVTADLSFNAAYLGGDLVNYANKNLDYWFVGNLLGTGPLGVYYLAYVLPNLIRQRVTGISHDVLYPVVSRMQEAPERIAAAFLSVSRLVTFLLVPALLGLAVTADLAISIGFGDRWTEAVAPLRVLSLGAAVTALTVVARPIFPALGAPMVLVRIGLASLAVLLGGLALSTQVGTLEAVATAVVAAGLTEAVAILTQLKNRVGLVISRFFGAVSPFVLTAVVMAASVMLSRAWFPETVTPVIEATTCVSVGVVSYLGFGWGVFRSQFREQLSAIRGLIGLGGR